MAFLFTNPKRSVQMHTNLYNILADNARLQPDKVYVYSQNRKITYKQMYDTVGHLAQQLHQRLELSQNPIVAVSTSHSEIVLHLIWACLAAGICLAFLPLSRDPAQIKSLMGQIQARALVTDIPELQTEPWSISYETLQGRFSDSSDTLVAPLADTPAFIFQTSGTTGTAKWIQVRHGQFVGAIESMKRVGSLGHAVNQVAYITPPLSHSYGLSSLLEYSSVGASLILPRGDSTLGAITALINSPLANSITAIEGVPHFFAQMVRLITRINLPALQHIGFGGGRLDQEVINGIGKSYPKLSYSVRYGLTETPSVVSHKLFTPPYTDDWHSSGKILPIYNLQIVDHSGKAVPAGQQGEIQIKGETLAWPYYGETAVTDFFATGDIGYINADNDELYIVGRKSLFLKVRGYRLSPEYIESIIGTFEDILDCRVSGTDTGLLAEIVSTNNVISQQALHSFLATKLPSYAIPETTTFVAEIPRTASGKIKRY